MVLFYLCIQSCLPYYIINPSEVKYVSFIFEPPEHQKLIPLDRAKSKFVQTFIHSANGYTLEINLHLRGI